jgi:hypothetical protein
VSNVSRLERLAERIDELGRSNRQVTYATMLSEPSEDMSAEASFDALALADAPDDREEFPDEPTTAAD